MAKATSIYQEYQSDIEKKYALHLSFLLQAKKIKRFDYHSERLKLIDYLYICPHFRIVNNEDIVEFHDVKKTWRDQSKERLKIAKNLHPYRFFAITLKNNQWQSEEV